MNITLSCGLTHDPQPRRGHPLPATLLAPGLMNAIAIAMKHPKPRTTSGALAVARARLLEPGVGRDTIQVANEALSRARCLREEAGIVAFPHQTCTQRSVPLAGCQRQALLPKRSRA
jgi:hypothetical protein